MQVKLRSKGLASKLLSQTIRRLVRFEICQLMRRSVRRSTENVARHLCIAQPLPPRSSARKPVLVRGVPWGRVVLRRAHAQPDC